ncbi:MAG TPA: anti-sigma factor [Xanthobacteraceae bacterium]|nr:anti-sigma factor [Xanthobacteraceae bacterium]
MIDRYPVTEDELHAYVDGELPADRLAAVEGWLAAHPDDMARVAAWRAQMDAIRERYGAVATEPVPARLDLARLTRNGRALKELAALAATVAFLVGGVVGWMAHGATAISPGGFQTFTKDALEAHKLYVVEVRHPVEVPGSEATHLVQWLSKRVGYSLRAPNLEKMGLHLVGGRLLPGPTGAAAFFMYENASGERFTLYCARSKSPDTAMRYDAAERVAAFYWVDNDVAYVVSGVADRSRLWKVAEAAYEQIDSRTTGQGS